MRARKRSPLIWWREALADRVLRDDPRLDELQQVVGTAGLRAGARKAVAAERLAADERAGDGAIDVEVSRPEFLRGAADVRRGAREESARQRVLAVVGEGERVVEVVGTHDREDRPEDLLGGDPGARPVRHHDRRADVPSAGGDVVTPEHHLALRAPELPVLPDPTICVLVDPPS